MTDDLLSTLELFLGEGFLDRAIQSAKASRVKKVERIKRAGSYRTSPTKRVRRTKADIQTLKDELFAIVAEERPMTVRQIFYQAVSRGMIEKSEREYKNTICRLLAILRKDRVMPFDWISDNTRWMRKPDTYESMEDLLESSHRLYRRSIWKNQPVYVEVWLEKEALAGVLVDVTDKWDVPLMVTRGYPSLSFVHSAAASIAKENRPVHIYYFGDLDPSGVDIPRFVEQSIREYAPQVDLHFEVVAVSRDQVDEFGLQTRPTKKTDTRSKGFDGESVEVDAIKPSLLRAICDDCITRHIDADLLSRTQAVEEIERQTLQNVARNWQDIAADYAY